MIGIVTEDNAQQKHWSERGRATSVANANALGRPRRSVLSFAGAAPANVADELPLPPWGNATLPNPPGTPGTRPGLWCSEADGPNRLARRAPRPGEPGGWS